MASREEIYNQALLQIGHTRQVNVWSEGSQEARNCNAIYDNHRRTLLSMGKWGFAKTPVALALTGRARESWAFEYYYPNNCLTALEIERSSKIEKKIPFQTETYYEQALNIEKRVIVTNREFARLIYIRDVQLPSMFSPCFVQALASRMSMDLSVVMAKDNGQKKRADYAKDFQFWMDQAVRVGEVEAEDEEQQDPAWITDR